MKILLGLFTVTALMLLGSTNSMSPGDRVQEARYLREKFIQKLEATYHHDLHVEQEKLVQSLKRSDHKNTSKVMATNADDIQALKALYKSTNGSQWNNNTGWMKGDPCNPFWYGIYCYDGRVRQINLVYNGLTGPIPAELSKATALEVLRLYSNLVSGRIPKEIFEMQSLQVLDVNTNIVEGGLPTEISMKSVQQLIIYSNQMGGPLPSSVDAPKLQTFELSSNQFTGPLPDGLGQSKSLQSIVVSRNMLTGSLPASYGNLENLQQLWIFYNNFNSPSIPNNWQGMTSMQNFQADGFTGTLPSWIGQRWSKLQYLILINGFLTGQFPPSLCDCRQMLSLRLFNNSFTGEIPQCLCQLRTLKDLELSDNGFIGPIPDCLGDMPGLESIYFSRNNMSGKFPSSVGYLKNLSIFDISQNSFYGSIPNTINNLKEIAEFAICYNKFSTVEEGADDFFSRIKQYGCQFYSNPWSCPVSPSVPKECQATCTPCNSGSKHSYCSDCIKDRSCGWCNEGPNCLDGSAQGPYVAYHCDPKKWTFGANSTCP